MSLCTALFSHRAKRLVWSPLFLILTLVGCSDSGGGRGGGGAAKKADDKVVIAMLPKLTNIAYFEACRVGAKQAADELGVELIYDGPTQASGSDQHKFIETWIRQRVDAI